MKKSKKRGNGEGCIRLLNSGYWEARITIGYGENGKQKFKTFTSKKKAIALEKLEKFKSERINYGNTTTNKYTLKDWLEIWYNSYVIKNVKNSTRVSYEGIIRNHLNPHIGHIKLMDLRKSHIDNMYYELLLNGKGNKKNTSLSVKTVRNIHLVLHKALQEALEQELIVKNYASIAKVPTMKNSNVEKKEIQILSKEEQNKLLKIAQKDAIYGAVVIAALNTGMRKGELLGLTWNDINFDKQSITIKKQLRRIKNYDTNINKKTILNLEYYTKTENSTRIIPMTNTLNNLLKEIYEKQNKWKKVLGTKYQDNNMVFCKTDGTFLDPDTVLQKYKQMLKDGNIKDCTFHALRHTFASRALESKISAKTVSKILGHSSVQFTLDTYTHVLEELQIEEMEKLDNYLKEIAI